MIPLLMGVGEGEIEDGVSYVFCARTLLPHIVNSSGAKYGLPTAGLTVEPKESDTPGLPRKVLTVTE